MEGFHTDNSIFDTASLTPAAATKVFTEKLGLRFGRQVYGGAGYCLSDVYKDGVKSSQTVLIQFAGAQKKMPTDSAHAGWAAWKVRLWNSCAFGLSLTDNEGGIAFIVGNVSPVITGDRYAPEGTNSRLTPVWKRTEGAAATFVKVNSVTQGSPELARSEYKTGEPTAENVDKLYGQVITALNKLAG
jgi:hypothetical protein